ncbi:hypothetical protein GCM10027610_002760 [Dactylosporangium cerinum]
MRGQRGPVRPAELRQDVPDVGRFLQTAGREDLLLALAAALDTDFMTNPTGFIGKSDRNIDVHADSMI